MDASRIGGHQPIQNFEQQESTNNATPTPQGTPTQSLRGRNALFDNMPRRTSNAQASRDTFFPAAQTSQPGSGKWLTPGMSPVEAATKMANGNWGAARVLSDLVQRCRNPMVLLNKMDDAGIRGARVWEVYKDVASEDAQKTFQLLLSLVNGRITPETLNQAIDSRTRLDPT